MISGSARGASFSGIDKVLVVAIACEHLRPTAEIHNQHSHAIPELGHLRGAAHSRAADRQSVIPPVCTENSNVGVLVIQSAENRVE